MSVLDHMSCTVYNASYEPLSVVSSKRGLILVIEGKAIVLQEHPEEVVHSASDIWPVPTQIVLKEFVKSRATHKVPAILTQRNLFLRDGWRCQYCGRHRLELKTKEFLTRDHIIPIARGGRNVWTNVITACSTCNHRKADNPLEITGLVLKKNPTVPTIFELWSRAGYKRSTKL